MQLRHRIGFTTAPLALVLFAACSGGGSSSSSSSQSAVTFAITDAASDDIETFNVDVTSVQLTKLGGAVVDILAAPVNVDLASLDDTSEILNVLAVPKGVYVSASITLDFTNAVCTLVGNSNPATILDSQGNALNGPITLPMDFGNHPFDAIGGKHHLLQFDFDLNQSVISDTVSNQVNVEPAFVMSFDPATGKKLVAFGDLVSVDTAASNFVADLKTKTGGSIGDVTVNTGAGTIFQIDGVPSVGATGLAALAAVPVATWIQVYGKNSAGVPKLDATFVEVGTGTYNGGTDIVEGLVIDRSGGAGADATFTVLGHSNDSTHTNFQFDTQFAVTTSFANTKVVRPFAATPYDTDEINVGQRVRVFGALTGTDLDATGATDVIREQITRCYGTANAAPTGAALSMNLTRVDLRNQNLFTWADGGSTPVDPTQFDLDIGNLAAGLNISTGTALQARGYFSGVAASGANFTAVSLANLNNAPSLLVINDQAATGFTVTTTALPASIDFSISGAAANGEAAIIDQGFAGVSNLPTNPDPTIVPKFVVGFYVIHDHTANSVKVFLKFKDFSDELASDLSGGAFLDHLSAIGKYDALLNRLKATVVSAAIH